MCNISFTPLSETNFSMNDSDIKKEALRYLCVTCYESFKPPNYKMKYGIDFEAI